jgi:hypothetical protein
MANLTDDVLKWTLDINGQPAMKELNDLEQSTKDLERTNKDLRVELQKMEAAGKKNTDEYKRLQNQMKGNKATIEQNKSQMDKLRKEVGLNALTAKQLRQEYRHLKTQMDNTTPGTAEWKRLEKQLGDVKNRLGQVNVASKKTNQVMGAFKSILPALGFAAVAAGAKQLLSNIIAVRQQFEKYEAVLRVSLGSQKAASRELNMLKQFAAETPFALSELTGAYVKLTNYGLKPTREELTKYGDVAASVGKSFDQYVEAIADAVTFEFERLKEFGIKAKKEGDKISFTFKEQTTVVDANSQAIKEYMASLGELEGVQGSMAAISETLGGRISNLGDAWDMLLDTLGGQTSGVFITAINWLVELINMVTMAFRSIESIKEQVNQNMAEISMKNALKEVNIISASLIRNGVDFQTAQKRALELYNQQMQKSIEAAKAQLKNADEPQKEALQKRINLMVQEVEAVKAYNEQMDAQALIRQKKEEERLKKEADKIKKLKNDIYKSLHGSTSGNYNLNSEEAMLQQFRPQNEELPDFDPMATMNEFFAQQQELLKQQYADGIIDQETYLQILEDNEVAHLMTMIEIKKALGEDTVALESQLADKKIEIAENEATYQKQLNADIKNAAIDSAQQISEAIFSIKQNQIQAELDAKLSAIDKEREAELANQNLTEEEKEAINEKYRKKEAAIKLAAWKKEKNAALSQAAINGALAITKTFATYGFTPAAWVAAAAQGVSTAAQIAVIASQKPPEFRKGGYTDQDASDDIPAGIVHTNEFVANRYATQNPTVRPVLDMIDYAQRNGSISTLNLPAMIKSVGYKSGGYVQNASNPEATTEAANYTPLISAINRFEDAVSRLQAEGIKGKWVYQDFKTIQRKEESAINKTT